jgi:putative flippase GtrA
MTWAGILHQWSLVRYALTGVGLLVLDVLVFFVLADLADVPIAVSQIVARSTGAITGFFLHKRYTFNKAQIVELRTVKEGGAYLVLVVVMVLISPLVVHAMIDLFGGHLLAGKIASDVLLLLITFPITKLVFGGRWRV